MFPSLELHPNLAGKHLARDPRFTTRAIDPRAGNVIDRINYDAFGNILSSVNPNASNAATALATRFLFTGQEWDADAHLYNYTARWYDPATCTFIYRYVGNSPTNAVDPSGLIDCTELGVPDYHKPSVPIHYEYRPSMNSNTLPPELRLWDPPPPVEVLGGDGRQYRAEQERLLQNELESTPDTAFYSRAFYELQFWYLRVFGGERAIQLTKTLRSAKFVMWQMLPP